MTLDAKAFIDALHTLEASRDVEPIAALFSQTAAISNPLATQNGAAGATAFWTAYRSSFDDLESRFSAIVEKDNLIVLEWKSAGHIKGEAIDYEGVSVIETADDRICAFRTYFDPRRLDRTLQG